MQVASRPRFTAGVALVGASLVVASTVAPVPNIHLPDIHLPALRTAEINLAAAANPLAIYSQVLHDALANVGGLIQGSDPGLVLKQILANQLGSVGTLGAAAGGIGADVATHVQAAVSQLAAGNVAGAVGSLAQIPAGVGQGLGELTHAVLTVLIKPLQNLANVVKQFTSDTLGTELILAGFIGPLISAPFAAIEAIQKVVGAVGTLNPAAIASALLAAPATVVDGLLNGGYGPDLGPIVGSPFPVKAGGIFSLPNLIFNPDGSFFVNTGGPFAALEAALKKIAAGLAQQPATAVKAAQPDPASVPSTAATTVTLNTGSAAVSLPVKSTASAEPAASDSTGADATKPAAADTPKDSSAVSGTTPAASTGTESNSTTKDSTSKPDSTSTSGDTKPTGPAPAPAPRRRLARRPSHTTRPAQAPPSLVTQPARPQVTKRVRTRRAPRATRRPAIPPRRARTTAATSMPMPPRTHTPQSSGVPSEKP